MYVDLKRPYYINRSNMTQPSNGQCLNARKHLHMILYLLVVRQPHVQHNIYM